MDWWLSVEMTPTPMLASLLKTSGKPCSWICLCLLLFLKIHVNGIFNALLIQHLTDFLLVLLGVRTWKPESLGAPRPLMVIWNAKRFLLVLGLTQLARWDSVLINFCLDFPCFPDTSCYITNCMLLIRFLVKNLIVCSTRKYMLKEGY